MIHFPLNSHLRLFGLEITRLPSFLFADLIPAHDENDAILWYFMMRGAASFVAEHGRWPGSPVGGNSPIAATVEGGDQQYSAHVVELDLPSLRSHVNRILTSSGVAVNRVSDDYVHVS